MSPADDEFAARSSRFVALAAGLGAIGFILAFEIVNWLATQHVYGSLHDALDVGLYQFYGRAVLDGRIPYRDFGLEYPPFALPAFLLPAILTGGTADAAAYRTVFQAAMLLCGVLTLVAVVWTVSRLTVRPADVLVATGFLAISPLLMGPVILARFDLWPALLTAIAMAAVIGGRNRLGAAVLALAILAKVYPLVLVPLLAAYVWRRSGRRETLICAAIAGAVVIAVLGPFLVVAQSGTIDALTRAIDRPLQVESLGAAILFVLHGLTGTPLDQVFSFGSDNLEGPVPATLAAVQSAATLVALLWIWARFARGAAEPVRLAVASAAALCAYVALGKVLSDNYVTWLLPLVLLVPGRGGRIAMVVLGEVLLLTAFIYPTRYPDYVGPLELDVAIVVLLRVLGIVVLATYLARQIGRVRSPARILG